MVRHTVVFKLKHGAGSGTESDLRSAATMLATIPCINNFECPRQISPKTALTLAFLQARPHRHGGASTAQSWHSLHGQILQAR